MKLLHARFTSSLALLFVLSACTPEINHALNTDWKAFKKHDVWDTVSVATGFRDAFPNNKEKMIRQDKNLCLHEDAERRELTASGLSDGIAYRYCTLTPSNGPVPRRWEGR